MHIEFTTARGAKIELSHDGRALQVSINGASASAARIENRAIGLCVITSRIDPVRKTTQDLVIQVAPDAIASVSALIPQPSKTSTAERFSDRINAEMDRVNSAY